MTGRRWLLPALFFAFVLIAVAEVWLLTFVGSRIGVLPTFIILVAEALVGAWLLRREGGKAWKALLDAFHTGRMPAGELADAAMVLLGGCLLILPGFFTDVIGLFLLLPFTRPLARKSLGFLMAQQAAKAGLDYRLINARFGSGTVIPGETVPDPSVTEPGPQPGATVIQGEIEA